MSFSGPGKITSVTCVPDIPGQELALAFRFDAILQATDQHDGQVFRHPIQTGGEGITDSVYLDPPVFSCNGIVGDRPISFLAPFGLDSRDRAINLYDHFLKLREAKVTMTLLMSWRPPMRNRWPKSVQGSRDQQSGNTINMSVMFEKLRFAQTQVVPAQVDSEILLLATQTVDLGTVPSV